MSAQILDGKKLATDLKESLRKEVAGLKDRTGDVPYLVNLLLGDNPGSCAYAKSQKKAAQHIGIKYDLKSLPTDISQEELIRQIKAYNNDPKVSGVMLHKPVPPHIDYNLLANHVFTEKDVEGINVRNIGQMILGKSAMVPCTPAAVMEHIKSTGAPLRGSEAVVVGHSGIVGKPLSLLLLEQYATVTICHVATSEAGRLADHVKRADVLVVAVGKAGLIKGKWIKEGAIVVDVGINRVGDEIVGDVEFEEARKRAAFITPVPGGVGPVTVVMLMRNGIEAYKNQIVKKENIKT